MNSLTIAGNIARNIEVRFMPNGDAVGNFSIADNQGKDKPAIFWNCQIYGKRAQSLEQYLVKGQAVTVTGTVSEREWTDKQGQPRKTMEVKVQELALQGGKREGGNDSAPQQQRQAQQAAPAKPAKSFDDFEDDIPFMVQCSWSDPLFAGLVASYAKE